MIQDVEAAIREYIPSVIHMSLGTAVGNKPWVCEVHFAYDDDLNLYFRSTTARRHSQEIAINPNVAGNIIRQHQPGEKPRGVYFEGTAEKLSEINADHIAYKTIVGRFGQIPNLLEDAAKPDGAQFYKITVNKFYVFDTIDSKPAQKYELDWPK